MIGSGLEEQPEFIIGGKSFNNIFYADRWHWTMRQGKDRDKKWRFVGKRFNSIWDLRITNVNIKEGRKFNDCDTVVAWEKSEIANKIQISESAKY